jgi:hypothetical protein
VYLKPKRATNELGGSCCKGKALSGEAAELKRTLLWCEQKCEAAAEGNIDLSQQLERAKGECSSTIRR